MRLDHEGVSRRVVFWLMGVINHDNNNVCVEYRQDVTEAKAKAEVQNTALPQLWIYLSWYCWWDTWQRLDSDCFFIEQCSKSVWHLFRKVISPVLSLDPLCLPRQMKQPVKVWGEYTVEWHTYLTPTADTHFTHLTCCLWIEWRIWASGRIYHIKSCLLIFYFGENLNTDETQNKCRMHVLYMANGELYCSVLLMNGYDGLQNHYKHLYQIINYECVWLSSMWSHL